MKWENLNYITNTNLAFNDSNLLVKGISAIKDTETLHKKLLYPYSSLIIQTIKFELPKRNPYGHSRK